MSAPLQAGVESPMVGGVAPSTASPSRGRSSVGAPTSSRGSIVPSNRVFDSVDNLFNKSYEYANNQATIKRGPPPKAVTNMILYIVIATVIMILALVYVIGSRKFEDTKYSSVFGK